MKKMLTLVAMLMAAGIAAGAEHTIGSWYDLILAPAGQFDGDHVVITADLTPDSPGYISELGESILFDDCTIDGRMHKIIGANIVSANATGDSAPSLFSFRGTCTISNLYVQDVTATYTGAGADWTNAAVGLLADTWDGTLTIHRVVVQGTAGGASAKAVGGMIGMSYGEGNTITITESCVLGPTVLYGDDGWVGGLVGNCQGSEVMISNVFVHASITDTSYGADAFAGGFFGTCGKLADTQPVYAGPAYFYGSVLGGNCSMGGNIEIAADWGGLDGPSLALIGICSGAVSSAAMIVSPGGAEGNTGDIGWINLGGNAEYLYADNTEWTAVAYTNVVTPAYSSGWAGYVGWDFNNVWDFPQNPIQRVTALPQFKWMLRARDAATVDFK